MSKTQEHKTKENKRKWMKYMCYKIWIQYLLKKIFSTIHSKRSTACISYQWFLLTNDLSEIIS